MAGQGRQRQPGIARLKSEKTPGGATPGVLKKQNEKADFATPICMK